MLFPPSSASQSLKKAVVSRLITGSSADASLVTSSDTQPSLS